MQSLRSVLAHTLTFIKLIPEVAYQMGKVSLPVMFAFVFGATLLWGAIFAQWLDESIGGQAMFMFAMSAASIVSADFIKRRPLQEALYVMSRVTGLSTVLLTGAAILNQVFPTILALSWPVTQNWNVHITPVAVVLAAVILLILAARKRMTERN